MFLLLIVGVILGASSAPRNFVPSHFNDRIVGGRPSAIEEYPYQVSVHYYDFFTCGGSIISPRYVITAGHCTYEIPDKSLSVRASSNTTDKDGQYIPVKKIYRNPSFDMSTLDYDISILKLYFSIKFGEGALPIALAPKDFQVAIGENVIVTGWGTLSETGDLPTNLQVVQIPVISNEECQKAYQESQVISERMVCAGIETGGQDACQGDSGGPLVVDGLLVGIVSWGYGCGRPEYPGVYSRISEFRDFIQSVTQL